MFSVNVTRSVFLQINLCFLLFDLPIYIFRTSLIQALRPDLMDQKKRYRKTFFSDKKISDENTDAN